MLRNEEHLKEIRKLVKPHKWEIYLHGSRRMAEQLNVTSLLPTETDYDYAVGNPTCVEYLNYSQRAEFVGRAKVLGWSVLGKHWNLLKWNTVNLDNIVMVDSAEYDEMTASSVIIFEKVIDRDKVQVQWKANFVYYKDLFESINPAYYFDKFYKKNREEYRSYINEQIELRVKKAEENAKIPF